MNRKETSNEWSLTYSLLKILLATCENAMDDEKGNFIDFYYLEIKRSWNLQRVGVFLYYFSPLNNLLIRWLLFQVYGKISGNVQWWHWSKTKKQDFSFWGISSRRIVIRRSKLIKVFPLLTLSIKGGFCKLVIRRIQLSQSNHN